MALNRQLAVGAATLALIGGGVAIWMLGPPAGPAANERELATLGDFTVYAAPAGSDRETLRIRRDGKVVWSGPEGDFTRVEIVSTDTDVGGGSRPDIVAYGWTGGASCCLTYVAYSIEDGGSLLGTIPDQAGDTRLFVRSPAKEFAPAVLPSFDTVSNSRYGGNAGSPVARILIAYDRARFGLDLKRMKAPRPDAAPAYMVRDRTLVTALAQEAFEDDFVPPAMGAAAIELAYTEWNQARVDAAASDELLDETNPETFVTPALVLNEYVYKGHAQAGVTLIEALYADRPTLASAILRQYFTVLKDSRWLDDLDALNDQQLRPIIANYGRG